jgi:hypothetical protein
VQIYTVEGSNDSNLNRIIDPGSPILGSGTWEPCITVKPEPSLRSILYGTRRKGRGVVETEQVEVGARSDTFCPTVVIPRIHQFPALHLLNKNLLALTSAAAAFDKN